MYRVKNFLYLLFIVAVVGSVLFLLAFRDQRRNLVVRVGERWTQVADDSSRVWGKDEEIFKLPAPPPKQVDPKVVSVMPKVIFQADPEQGGVLYADLNPPTTDQKTGEEADSKKQAPELKKTQDLVAAYNHLTQKSEVARKLVAGAFQEYQFVDWKPIQQQPPVSYIQIAAKRTSDGQLLPFVWSVNTESGEIRPLSQMARDLESRNR